MLLPDPVFRLVPFTNEETERGREARWPSAECLQTEEGASRPGLPVDAGLSRGFISSLPLQGTFLFEVTQTVTCSLVTAANISTRRLWCHQGREGDRGVISTGLDVE